MAEIFVAAADSFLDGDRRIIVHGRQQIGVFRWDGAFYAYANVCPHQGGPACEGLLMHQVEDVLRPDRTWVGQKFSEDRINVVCPWHGFEYDLKSGICVADAHYQLRPFPVVEKGGAVYVVAS
jgi:nitrite reductase/ring-hydroxylating ferredoxin subunit